MFDAPSPLVHVVIFCAAALTCWLVYSTFKALDWVVRYHAATPIGRRIMLANASREKNGLPPLTDEEESDYMHLLLCQEWGIPAHYDPADDPDGEIWHAV
jgi:hypothetical protein